jgi:hypothetical protein
MTYLEKPKHKQNSRTMRSTEHLPASQVDAGDRGR